MAERRHASSCGADLGGAQGNLSQGWSWLSTAGAPGWTFAGTGDFNGDGKLDLVWQNDSSRQVVVWYMSGAQGNAFLWSDWLSASGVPWLECRQHR